MKRLSTLIVGLSLCSVRLFGAESPAPLGPVVIEGLGETVYRMVAMMKGLNMTDKLAGERLAALIMADDRIDGAEARLIEALAAERFSVILRPGAGSNYRPAEVQFAGSLHAAARAALREAAPLDYRAVMAAPDPAGLRKLAIWLTVSAERRAEARAWLAGRAEEERSRQPQVNGEWGHYRVFVNALYEQFKAIGGVDGLELRKWAFEGLRLHDRQRGDAVPDFLYSYFLDGVAELQARRAAIAAADAVVLPALK